MTHVSNPRVACSDEVRTGLAEGRGVVALETTIVVHGLPRPTNLDVARECEAAVRAAGSIPATIGVLDGRVIVGLCADQLESLADPASASVKLSTRDIGFAVGLGRHGATTVAATIGVAHRVGIDVMATGGLGGVHRDAARSFDESADLTALARTPVLVVASGVKSILDVGATLERLDSLGVAVVGYRTHQFPGFYRRDSGFTLDWSLTNPRDVATTFLAHRTWATTGLVLANPVDPARQLDAALHDEALASALAEVRRLDVRGKDVTPVLLAEFARFTAGVSVLVNRDLVVANAGLAGEVATALAAARQ